MPACCARCVLGSSVLRQAAGEELSWSSAGRPESPTWSPEDAASMRLQAATRGRRTERGVQGSKPGALGITT